MKTGILLAIVSAFSAVRGQFGFLRAALPLPQMPTAQMTINPIRGFPAIPKPIPKVFPPGFFAPDSVSINTRPAILEFPKPVNENPFSLPVLPEDENVDILVENPDDSQNEENSEVEEETEEQAEVEEDSEDQSEAGQLGGGPPFGVRSAHGTNLTSSEGPDSQPAVDPRSDVHVTVEFHDHSEDGDDQSEVEEEHNDDQLEVEEISEDQSEVEEQSEVSEDQSEVEEQSGFPEDQSENVEQSEVEDVQDDQSEVEEVSEDQSEIEEVEDQSELEDQSEVEEVEDQSDNPDDQSEIEEEVIDDQSEVEEEAEDDQSEVEQEVVAEEELGERSNVHVTVEFHEHSEDEDEQEGNSELHEVMEEESTDGDSNGEMAEEMIEEEEESDEGAVDVAMDRVDPITNLIKSTKLAAKGAKQIVRGRKLIAKGNLRVAKGTLKVAAGVTGARLTANAVKATTKIASKVLPGGLPGPIVPAIPGTPHVAGLTKLP